MVELKEMAGPLTVVKLFNFQFSIFNEFSNNNFQFLSVLEMDIPEKLKMSELKLGEGKNEDEILRIVGLLTGYHAIKARGKRVKLEIKIF